MSKKSRCRNALAVGGALTVAAALSTAGVALATAPKQGWTYTTQPTAKVSVTFKVSANGKRVTNLGAGIAIKCKGSAGGFPQAKPGSGNITKTGTFKVVLKLYPLGGASQKSSGTDTVTGTFVKGGKATGTVLSYFDFQGANSFCTGVKQNYTAIGTAQ
ncbi:MAG: hypothetical protein ABR947_02360 [Solirubrobacteraceae bacterium]|jgi:hypothetical protein